MNKTGLFRRRRDEDVPGYIKKEEYDQITVQKKKKNTIENDVIIIMVKETIREQINAFDGLNLGTVSQRVHTPWLFGAVAFAGIYARCPKTSCTHTQTR